MKHPLERAEAPYIAGFAILLLVLAYGGYRYYTLERAYQSQVAALTSSLADASSTNQALQDALTEEKTKNDGFESEIDDIENTVGTLNKLANTDPQLLAKYSKVYFLNENYVPASLSDIPSDDVSDPDQTQQFLTQALPFLTDLLDAAHKDGVDILVASAYRSFADQANLKEGYTTTFGTGANSFSADQGYSEHELGTAVDFTTKATGGALDGFDTTDAYTWLTDNAYQYGFILSYPPGNVFYEFEPWHWRFVGVALATKLHDDNEHFYDLDQRDINTYLVHLFDPK